MATNFASPETIPDLISRQLVELLNRFRSNLNLDQAILDINFPVFATDDGTINQRLTILSPKHGVIAFLPAALIDQSPSSAVEEYIAQIKTFEGEILAKLIKNPNTRNLITDVHCAIFAPHLQETAAFKDAQGLFLRTTADVLKYINEREQLDLSGQAFSQLQATMEMSNVLKKTKARVLSLDNSKGRMAASAELEIATFDRTQVETFLSEITGLERIKGLAGSGKTVVLAVKAAIIHAFYPQKKIAFTYFTRSLHQQVTRLITDFHQCLTDSEPNWDNMMVMHGWGGKSARGFYYEVCKHHKVPPKIYSQVANLADPFDYICTELLKTPNLEPIFDYVFVDEGQDFPGSFLKLANQVTKDHKLVWAYDAFQNIFNVKAPRAEDIFDGKQEIDDHALKKCYRNSGEVLVTAHAVGLGIYGKIVQILENQEYWEDLGYELEAGELKAGELVTINRLKENSLMSISNTCKKEEIVIAIPFSMMKDEIEFVVNSIKNDIQNDELRPDDIMVISVDQRNASAYLDGIEASLTKIGIKARNLRADPAGGSEFFKARHVTLSTVNKAKGNEAYMVYVVGTDSIFNPAPDPISRNTLFTAITRAKGWVRITGTGKPDCDWKKEIDSALLNAPKLKFKYPTKEELVVMERELQKGQKLIKQREKLEIYLDQLTDEDLEIYLAQRKSAKKKLQEFTDSIAERYKVQALQSESLESLFTSEE